MTAIPIGIYNFPNAGTGSYCPEYGSPCGTATQRLQQYEAACGVTASYCLVFTSDGSLADWVGAATGPWAWTNEGGPFASPANGGRLTPVLSMPLATRDGAMTFQTVAAGTNDSMIITWIKAWIDQGYTTLVVRPQWEFVYGGTVFGNQGTGSTYTNWSVPFIAAWKHLSDLLRNYAASRGATLKMVWNPGFSNGLQYTGAATNSYPYGNDASGRHYADYVGPDFYDNCYPHGDGNPTIPYPTYPGYASLAPSFAADGGVIGSYVDINDWANPPSGSNWKAADNMYHFFDWPDGRENSYCALLKGNEKSWGVMDAIYFAKQTSRPLFICESGLFLNVTGVGAVSPYIDGNSGAAPWNNGAGDVWFPQYMKSRLAFAQAQGVTVACMMIFVAGPNDFLGPFPQVATAYKNQAF